MPCPPLQNMAVAHAWQPHEGLFSEEVLWKGNHGHQASPLHQLVALGRTTYRSSTMAIDVPKGQLAVYVGESQRLFLYLKHASFQSLLRRKVEEEMGSSAHGSGSPRADHDFVTLTAHCSTFPKSKTTSKVCTALLTPASCTKLHSR
ncbi:hypothetical protein Taro_008812 [Colocasia esculenta]|uniref:Uncharacterized protein n=1 Tax=Colocasia esculenta TaxID=4460 RepID=A0A843U804_COLES|nr:hypothetical protein [Colocasia esculenta]